MIKRGKSIQDLEKSTSLRRNYKHKDLGAEKKKNVTMARASKNRKVWYKVGQRIWQGPGHEDFC